MTTKRLPLPLLALLLAGCPGTPPPVDGGTDARTRDAGSCATDAECDDGLYCNGVETCSGGVCTAGTAPLCDDGVACTTDRCSEERSRCESGPPDVDGDGYGAMGCGSGNDCDDDDPLRYPGALEVCDETGRDEDCDPSTFGDRDVDGDSFVSTSCCNGTTCGTDCNDAYADVRPDGTETCNGLDDDCSGTIDEGVSLTRYVDADRDGWGAGAAVMGCAGVPGLAADGGDCDDTPRTGIARSPGQPEVCDGVDNDCNDVIDDGALAVTWYRDLDGDGFGASRSGTTFSCAPVAGHSLLSSDCDDGMAARSPGATEACNAIDDDCNGVADYRVGPGDFEDDDRDGTPDMACGGALALDCDDLDPATLAGSAEICDGRDNDCDGTIDEGATTAVFFRDADGDGYGSEGSGAVVACAAPTGYSVRGGDCDDLNPTRSPRAPDACNGADDDCDGTADEAAASASCTLPGVTASVCIAGDCDYDRCTSGFADCDFDRTNGCEANVDLDPERCGSCGRSCGISSESSRFGCSAGACTVTCNTGWSNCDGRVDNGCETLGASCPVCMMTDCAGDCADLSADPDHCGACGVSCGAGGTCTGGFCDRFVDIAVGVFHSCGLREGGGVACWGANDVGQLGVATVSTGPVTVPLAAPAVDLACGSGHCCAALVDGRVECWGDNSSLQLGGTGPYAAGTHLVSTLAERIRAIGAGYRHTVAVTYGGVVISWGDNNLGQATGYASAPVAPTTIFALSAIDPDAIAAGNLFTCFGAYSAGPRCIGVLPGFFDTSSVGDPVTLGREDPGFDDGSFASGAAGLDHLCFVLDNGVWCAGADGNGQIAGASSPPRIAPTPFTALARSVGATLRTTCVASYTGVVSCSGEGSAGELGGLPSTSTPVALPTTLRASAISSGDTRHFCAIDLAGRPWCWGRNTFGESAPGGPGTVPPALVSGL